MSEIETQVERPILTREDQQRRQIQGIMADTSTSPAQKHLLVQQLMSAGYRGGREAAEVPQHVGQPAACASYHDEEKGVLGCKHYNRACKIKAPCCDRFFTCRFCHDESSDHQMDRYLVEEMMCMHCFHEQPVSKTCQNPDCGKEMARYFCDTCNFFENADKDIYHCPHCKLCRVGKGLGIDYFHCQKCNACMHIGLTEHKCVERSLESNCPICSDFMFTSTTPVTFLNCGHCMHVTCYEQYVQTSYTCPVCLKSLGDMTRYFKRLDDHLAQEVMPAEYADWVSHILCNDCEHRTTAKYHFSYHKCADCGSYNTKVVSHGRAPPQPIDAPPQAPQAGAVQEELPAEPSAPGSPHSDLDMGALSVEDATSG